MQLFLRLHCEAYAIEKFGSLKQLDEEFEKRKSRATELKALRFKKKVTELRTKTRTAEWLSKREERMKKQCDHEFEEGRCRHCDMTIEEEEF